MKVDRATGLVVLLVAIAYGIEARSFEAGFMADPIGPQAFPKLLGTFLAGLGICLIIRPDDTSWPSNVLRWRWGVVIVALFSYAAFLEFLGFLLSTSLLLIVFSFLLGGRLSRSVIVALVFSTASYVLFHRLLSIPLPPGTMFFGGN